MVCPGSPPKGKGNKVKQIKINQKRSQDTLSGYGQSQTAVVPSEDYFLIPDFSDGPIQDIACLCRKPQRTISLLYKRPSSETLIVQQA